ncbi:hypothetical protein [uncultured Desulfovibrio sp.]|uniref:hypothetical protein n=1 Tax=uncultured Desulfovibrio sp. TaxID=167968 RepID=UPI002628B14E|nr:hypothetical protein [uncultured Desulfovibrio sp.]
MGSFIPFSDEEPFVKRVKSLADDELLEIWEETQQIESLLCTEFQTDISFAPDYEKVIVQELRLRSCRKLRAPEPGE